MTSCLLALHLKYINTNGHIANISSIKVHETGLHILTKHTDVFNSTKLDTKARLKLLYGNAIGGLMITLLCMAVLCFAFDTPEQQSAKTTIFFVLAGVHSLRLIDNLWTTQQFNNSNFNPKAAVWRLSIGIIANSIIWATYSVLFVPTMQNIEITITAVIMSALAGGAITILAASSKLSLIYMTSLILPFSIMGFFSELEYFHYISYLGISFWFVMLVSAGQAGKFISETLSLKNQNTSLLALMNIEKQEVERINNQLVTVNKQLDLYNYSLESQVEKRTEEIYRLSNVDPLTNLMNRSAFLFSLTELIRREINGNGKQQYALLFVDLDGFKDVNDGFGHSMGDAVLREIAMRLKEHESFQDDNLSEDNILCRWGGDEFLLLVPIIDACHVGNLARNIQLTVAKPINVASNNITLGASIGIAQFPGDSTEAHELIQYADISMYHHKKQGEGAATYFSPSLFVDFQHDQVIRDGLKYALVQNEFSLVYQPIVDIHTNQTWAIEALLRWQHKERAISPSEFIPIAEKSGRIVEIGAWVLDKACQDAAKWSFDANPAVSVNVSSLQLLDANFIDVISCILSKTGLRPTRLHLEITESVMLENDELARLQLKALEDMGIHISIDDFGTGFSSLNQLQRMSFDIIKIDRSFLQNLNKKDLTIISAAKLIADEFGAKTVAEGIETQSELAVLKEIGIRYIQGYLLARPMPNEALCHWIKSFTSDVKH
ncbi:MAG: diguanylate cyclase (GGDEF)-like protein [Cellvibrionaceae bacterium]